MGFNRRKVEADRKAQADAEAVTRRASDAQMFGEDAERLIGAWNDRQARRMPMLFSPTIGAAITARYWFLWARCPACRTRSLNPPARGSISGPFSLQPHHRALALRSLLARHFHQGLTVQHHLAADRAYAGEPGAEFFRRKFAHSHGDHDGGTDFHWRAEIQRYRKGSSLAGIILGYRYRKSRSSSMKAMTTTLTRPITTISRRPVPALAFRTYG
jgi:hypothetical protein